MTSTPGLPLGFTTKTDKSSIRAPAQINPLTGDRLDRVERELPTEERPETRPEPQAPPQMRKPAPQRALTNANAVESRTRPVRKQINLRADIAALYDELHALVAERSGQKNLSDAELFAGLILALDEAKRELDLSSIQSRGAWGTPAARNFPAELKTRFQRAIAQHEANRRAPSPARPATRASA